MSKLSCVRHPIGKKSINSLFFFVSATSSSTSVQMSSPSCPRFKRLNFLSASFFVWPFIKKSNVTFFHVPHLNQPTTKLKHRFVFVLSAAVICCNCQVLQRCPALPRLLLAPRGYAAVDQVQIQTRYKVIRPTVGNGLFLNKSINEISCRTCYSKNKLSEGRHVK